MISNEVVIASLMAKKRAEIERRNRRIEDGIKVSFTLMAIEVIAIATLSWWGVIY